MVDEFFVSGSKSFNLRLFVMIGLIIIVLIGSLFIGGNMSCKRGGGYMSGFACVDVINYGVCESGSDLLIVDVNGSSVDSFVFNSSVIG